MKVKIGGKWHLVWKWCHKDNSVKLKLGTSLAFYINYETIFQTFDYQIYNYRSGTANSNTVNSKLHLIQSLGQDFARFLSFHGKNAWLISNTVNSKFH